MQEEVIERFLIFIALSVLAIFIFKNKATFFHKRTIKIYSYLWSFLYGLGLIACFLPFYNGESFLEIVARSSYVQGWIYMILMGCGFALALKKSFLVSQVNHLLIFYNFLFIYSAGAPFPNILPNNFAVIYIALFPLSILMISFYTYLKVYIELLFLLLKNLRK